MTTPGEMTRRVTFQAHGPDANGDPLGAWADVVTRWAKITPNIGGEGVMDQRIEGTQPVVIYVRRDAETKAIDNSYRAVDAFDTATIWNVSSVIRNEREDMMEVLAVQRRNGSDA
jgi:head-tail adaptor